jgi:hypothetical protein
MQLKEKNDEVGNIKEKFPRTVAAFQSVNEKNSESYNKYYSKFFGSVRGGYGHDAANDMYDAAKAGITDPAFYTKALETFIEKGWTRAAVDLLCNLSSAGVTDPALYRLALIDCINKDKFDSAVVLVSKACNLRMSEDEFFAMAVEYFGKYGETDKISEIVAHLASLAKDGTPSN